MSLNTRILIGSSSGLFMWMHWYAFNFTVGSKRNGHSISVKRNKIYGTIE
ncbi:hypothetical protein [Ferruginibacter sp.]|nr:hypothetical protein [Ferruginibacter sp.]